ncbi:hypothetical protein IL38_23725 [Actinopolyspora erythraea]|uniref:2OGFeDO JBP1/TET oxygenase domain-containing protein n=1 Tax=Actinopolyspora erythraea TaxID=414996 RepID=A0ABR4WYM9_9ACTN|nr:hypothetical protein [Actinopolyspora erythraea]KGI79323.1 hypothetical protein IL38_23725 [Actinopolyspora erythraea]
MIDLRLRTRLADEALTDLAGKVLGFDDYDVLLTGPTFVRMPNGRPLCCYLPGALTDAITDDIYDVLHSLKTQKTSNRGLASGTRRMRRGSGDQVASRTEARSIPSSVIGAVDPMGQTLYCRLTAWTGRNLPQWEQLHPLLRAIATHYQRHVPDRYANQMAYVRDTDPAWVVEGTPFTTVTCNNSYPTGVHTDKGDLDAGFSTLACLRRGEFTGGQLVFPQFRVAVDMADGDLMLMDAHQWHGNVPIHCACGTQLNGPCPDCSAERISVVAYYRTRMAECGSPEEERDKAMERADRKLSPDSFASSAG